MACCEECRKLKEEMVRWENVLREFRATESDPEMEHQFNRAACQRRAEYEIHRVVDHDDKRYRGNLLRNAETLLWFIFSPNKVLN